MDRHGARTRCWSIDAHCDDDCHLRTHCNRDALDPIPNPQPDSVDRDGYHHQYGYLYSHCDLHCYQHSLGDTLPASNDNLYTHLHADSDNYLNAYLHTDPDQYFYADCLFHVAAYIHSLSYNIPNHIRPIT